MEMYSADREDALLEGIYDVIADIRARRETGRMGWTEFCWRMTNADNAIYDIRRELAR